MGANGQPGRTHCGRWLAVDRAKYNTGRLVCTKPAFHAGAWHQSGWSGWLWFVSLHGTRTTVPVRDWTCNGWVDELKGRCGRVLRATEDEARVAGWKIGTRNGIRDPLCPQCAKPDPATSKLLRDLERSVAR